MRKGFVVNHVMSNSVYSGIFKDIIEYFNQYSPSGIKHTVSEAALEEADIYHYHRPNLESKLMNPSVCTVHHDLDDTDKWLSIDKFIPRYLEADAIICLNSVQKERLLGYGVPANKIHVVFHGYNNKNLSLKQKNNAFFSGEKFVLGIASKRYGRRVKGEAYLLELMKRLDPAMIAFVLIGKDRLVTAKELREFGFECKTFERLPYRIFQEFYNTIDALLITSLFEGGPASLPEALGTGTPVFTSPVGMVNDMLENGVNGHVLSMSPGLDASLIMKYAEEKSSGEETWNSLVDTCKQRACTVPTWRDSILGNIGVYQKVLSVREV